jgi:hypothetical protein
MFLTGNEIRTLTGKIRHSAQVRWLREHGYKVEVNGLGVPVVAVAEVNRKMVGAQSIRKQEPNWGAMERG